MSAQLPQHGVVCNVALTVSRFSAAASAAAESDLVAGLPVRLARYYAEKLPLSSLRLPAPLTFELEMVAAWHARTHHDPACQYFRAVLGSACAKARAHSCPQPIAAQLLRWGGGVAVSCSCGAGGCRG